MSNVTISLDDDLLKKAKKIAIDRETSFNGLVRNYVEELVRKDELRTRLRIDELDRLFSESGAKVGKRSWTREELHER